MRGEDGLDEFTTAAPTRVWVAAGGTVTRDRGRRRRPRPAPLAPPATCAAATRRSTPTSARRVFAGEPGPVRDAVLVNAAAALAAHAGADADDLLPALRAGLERAAAAVDSGAAAATLARWVTVAQAAKRRGRM